jgi:hypothetical protein
MMVNISTNINKTNSHLSPLLTEDKNATTIDVGNSGSGLGQGQNGAGLIRLMGA